MTVNEDELRWFQRMLQPLHDKLDQQAVSLADLREDFTAMRDHVDVCVASALRTERGHTKLRDEIHEALKALREHHRRLEALEGAAS